MSETRPSASLSVPDTGSAHASVSVSSGKRPFVIVESLYIAGFEPRTRTDPLHKQSNLTYYVYEIVLENEAVGKWTVWRRYSDFAQLHKDIQRWAELRVKLEGVELRLPSRFTLFSRDPRELGARRAEQLQNSFLMPMFSAVGGVDLDFWHHPVIMAFFEVPVVRTGMLAGGTPSRDTSRNEMSATYGDANSWMEEFRKAEELVERVRKLVERHRRIQVKQTDLLSQSLDRLPTATRARTRIVTTNTDRVVESVGAKLDDLEKALDSGTQSGTELEIHKQALSKLRSTYVTAINELPTAHSAPMSSQQGRLTIKKEDSKSAPAKQAPSPPSHAPSKQAQPTKRQSPSTTSTQAKSAAPPLGLGNQSRQLEVIAHQRAAIQTQDRQLSQISLALRRQKLVATEINNEIDKESPQLDALARQLDQTKSKLDRNVEKVKRV